MANVQGYLVVDDGYRVDPILDGEMGTGYEERDYSVNAMNAAPFASARSIPSFSQAELLERIAEKTAKKTWIRDKCDRVGSKVKNQSRSSYCWIHAPVRGMECHYVLTGGVAHTLSAFYAGAHIKGGRNQGGWGLQGLEFLTKHGTCVESMHKPMDFSVNRDAEAAKNAAQHQVVGWEDIEPTDMMAIFTRIVLDMPVTFGIPAWGHEVLGTFLVVENGLILPGIDNSWGTSWGTNGRGVLRGKMTRFSEAGSVVSVEPSAT
jgi:hypothetical protein